MFVVASSCVPGRRLYVYVRIFYVRSLCVRVYSCPGYVSVRVASGVWECSPYTIFLFFFSVLQDSLSLYQWVFLKIKQVKKK